MFGIMLFEVLGLLLTIGGMAIADNYINIANYLHMVLGNIGLMTKAEGTFNLIDGMRVMAQVGREVLYLQYVVYSVAELMIIVGAIIVVISTCRYLFRMIINNKYARNN